MQTDDQTPTPENDTPNRAPYDVREYMCLKTWLAENDLSRALYYTLHPEDRPPTTKFGKKRVVVLSEVPKWRERIYRNGGAQVMPR
jgi:hypothetical protein